VCDIARTNDSNSGRQRGLISATNELAADDPSIILFGDSAKFDIANPDHVDIVRSIQAIA